MNLRPHLCARGHPSLRPRVDLDQVACPSNKGQRTEGKLVSQPRGRQRSGLVMVHGSDDRSEARADPRPEQGLVDG